MTSNELTSKTFRVLLALLLSVVAVGLGYAVLSLESASAGLGEMVASNLDSSGVSNPVTAVLLNFRGYDTLLELSVLLVALLGVWSLGGKSRQAASAVPLLLSHLQQILVPVLILVSGYLLWAGAHAPGGAFQAGSVLGAAGVLLLLSGWRLDEKFVGLPLRAVLALGLGIFLLVAALPLFTGDNFLQYPRSMAGQMILLIEAAATVSIGATLTALFLGGFPVTGDT